MPENPKEVVTEETVCCGHKRCPTVRVFADGGAELLEDDGSRIVLDAAQAARVAELLGKAGR